MSKPENCENCPNFGISRYQGGIVYVCDKLLLLSGHIESSEVNKKGVRDDCPYADGDKKVFKPGSVSANPPTEFNVDDAIEYNLKRMVDYIGTCDDRFKDYEKLTLQPASAEMSKMRDILELAKIVKVYYQKVYDHLRQTRLPEIMDGEDVSTVTFDGIGRVTLTSDIYASIISDHRDDAWDWLRDNNHGGMIKETINSGTLKAGLKAMIKKGETPPEHLFKITPFSRASITKVK